MSGDNADRIGRAYRAAGEALDERPSAATRATILAAAARQIHAAPRDASAPMATPVRRMPRWPMAAAAAVLLSTLAVMMAVRTEHEMPTFTPPAESEAARVPAAAPSAATAPTTDTDLQRGVPHPETLSQDPIDLHDQLVAVRPGLADDVRREVDTVGCNRPDVQVVNRPDAGLLANRLPHHVDVDASGGRLHEDVGDLAQQVPDPGDDEDGDSERVNGVGVPPAEEGGEAGGHQDPDRGEQIRIHLEIGAANVEVGARIAVQDPHPDEVAREPQRADERHAAEMDLVRIAEPVDGLASDEEEDEPQEDGVDLGRQDLDALVSVGDSRRRGPGREPGGEEREPQRPDVRQHVSGIGNADDLDLPQRGDAARDLAGATGPAMGIGVGGLDPKDRTGNGRPARRNLSPAVQHRVTILCAGSPAITAGAHDWRASVARAAPLAPYEARPDWPAFWLYSSGTTGKPKGIVHTHTSVAVSGEALRLLGINAGEKVFTTSKYFFAYGLEHGLLGPLALGATGVCLADWAEPEGAIAAVARHRPTAVFSVPSLYRRLLAEPAARLEPMRAERHFVAAGERLPQPVIDQWKGLLGNEILSLYGNSEAYCACLMMPPGAEGRGRTGRPLPLTEVRLRDADGREARAGEPGVLWLRHPALAAGYVNRPEQTQAQFEDGWYCTKDLFLRDAEGFYIHQGRSDELVKIAGQWVLPGELEETVTAEATPSYLGVA